MLVTFRPTGMTPSGTAKKTVKSVPFNYEGPAYEQQLVPVEEEPRCREWSWAWSPAPYGCLLPLRYVDQTLAMLDGLADEARSRSLGTKDNPFLGRWNDKRVDQAPGRLSERAG